MHLSLVHNYDTTLPSKQSSCLDSRRETSSHSSSSSSSTTMLDSPAASASVPPHGSCPIAMGFSPAPGMTPCVTTTEASSSIAMATGLKLRPSPHHPQHRPHHHTPHSHSQQQQQLLQQQPSSSTSLQQYSHQPRHHHRRRGHHSGGQRGEDVGAVVPSSLDLSLPSGVGAAALGLRRGGATVLENRFDLGGAGEGASVRFDGSRGSSGPVLLAEALLNRMAVAAAANGGGVGPATLSQTASSQVRWPC